MRVNVNTVMATAMAKVLQPQLPSLASTAMEALLAETKEQTEDPLLVMCVEMAAGWVEKDGVEAAQSLIERLSASLAGDGEGIATLKDSMSATQLTELADVFQSAEARNRIVAQRTMQRLGSVIGEMARIAGRAFLVALEA